MPPLPRPRRHQPYTITPLCALLLKNQDTHTTHYYHICMYTFYVECNTEHTFTTCKDKVEYRFEEQGILNLPHFVWTSFLRPIVMGFKFTHNTCTKMACQLAKYRQTKKIKVIWVILELQFEMHPVNLTLESLLDILSQTTFSMVSPNCYFTLVTQIYFRIRKQIRYIGRRGALRY